MGLFPGFLFHCVSRGNGFFFFLDVNFAESVNSKNPRVSSLESPMYGIVLYTKEILDLVFYMCSFYFLSFPYCSPQDFKHCIQQEWGEQTCLFSC